MKIKNLIVFLIAASFFMTLFFTQNAQAVTGDKTITAWEEFNLGVTSGSNANMTWLTYDTTGTASDITTGALSGKCLRLDSVTPTICYAWINLTDDYDYISSIHIWIEGISIGSDMSIYFYNTTNTVLEIIRTSTQWQYDPIDAGNTVFATAGATEDGWLNITHVSGNTMNYSWWENGGGTTETDEGGSANTATWTNFTRIYIVGTVVVQYIDDIIINTEISEGYTGGYGSIDGYGSICSGGITEYTQPYWLTYTYEWWDFNHMWGTSTKNYPQYIETQFPYTFTGKIGAVDLAISNDQYNLVSSATTAYYMYANGFPCGYPDYILEDNGNYILRWIITPESFPAEKEA